MDRVNRTTVGNPLGRAKFLEEIDLSLDSLVGSLDRPICQVGSGADVAVLETEQKRIGKFHGCVHSLVEFRWRECVKDVDVPHNRIVLVNQRHIVLAGKGQQGSR